jgi:hypothetical protein
VLSGAPLAAEFAAVLSGAPPAAEFATGLDSCPPRIAVPAAPMIAVVPRKLRLVIILAILRSFCLGFGKLSRHP